MRLFLLPLLLVIFVSPTNGIIAFDSENSTTLPTDAPIQPSGTGGQKQHDWLVVIRLILGAVALLGNVGTLSRRRRCSSVISSHTWLSSQSLADAACGLFIILVTLKPEAPASYCRFWTSGAWLWAAYMVSTYNLLALLYGNLKSGAASGVAGHSKYLNVVTLWAICTIGNVAYAAATSKAYGPMCVVGGAFKSVSQAKAVFGVYYCFQYIVPLAAGGALICYAAYLRRAVSLANVIPPERDAWRASVALAVCFAVCWMPNLAYVFAELSSSAIAHGWFYEFTPTLLYVKPCLTPLVLLATTGGAANGWREVIKRRGSLIKSISSGTRKVKSENETAIDEAGVTGCIVSSIGVEVATIVEMGIEAGAEAGVEAGAEAGVEEVVGPDLNKANVCPVDVEINKADECAYS